MARTISTALQNHLNERRLTVALLWQITPAYGPVEGYTSLDVDIESNGLLYSAAANVFPSAVPASLGLKTDSIDVTTLPDQADGRLSTQKLLTGYYDDARFKISLVNYTGDLDDVCVLAAGRLGKGTRTDSGVMFELLPWGELLSKNIGYNTLPTCQCPRFGRGRCRNGADVGGSSDGPDIADHTETGTLGTVWSSTHFLVTGINEPDGWATEGYIRFTSEASLNYQPAGDTTGYRVKKWSIYEDDETKREVWLHNTLPFAPEIGDAVVVERGCTRDVQACRSSPNRKGEGGTDDGTGNVVNIFMAFPYMPGVNIVITKNPTPTVSEDIDLLGLFS